MAFSHNNETDSQDNTIVVIKQGADANAVGVQSTRATGSEVGLIVRTIPFEPKTFVAYSPTTTIGNLKSMLSLFNAVGSTVKIKIHEVRIVNVQTTAVTGIVANFEVNRITAHSVGTALTPRPYDTSRTLDVNVTARTGATFTEAAGPITLMRAQWSSDEWGPGNIDTESSDHSVQLTGFGVVSKLPGCGPIVLNAGEGIHVKQVTNSAVGSFDLFIIFTEEPV